VVWGDLYFEDDKTEDSYFEDEITRDDSFDKVETEEIPVRFYDRPSNIAGKVKGFFGKEGSLGKLFAGAYESVKETLHQTSNGFVAYNPKLKRPVVDYHLDLETPVELDSGIKSHTVIV